VGHRAGLDDVERRKFLTLLGLKLRPLGHSASSQSLYRLSYPGSRATVQKKKPCISLYFPLTHEHRRFVENAMMA
jgi:hypothetical protein